MVAEGGIGQLMPCLRAKATMFAELFQYTFSLFGLTSFNSLTEDFTEGFWEGFMAFCNGKRTLVTGVVV